MPRGLAPAVRKPETGSRPTAESRPCDQSPVISMSCPRLRNEAYTGPRLNEQLDAQSREFVNNPAKNKLTPADKPQVSAIFSFYPKDFAKNGSTSVQDFINRYATQKIKADASLTYLEYNWALNEQ